MAQLFTPPFQTTLDSGGSPISSAKLKFFLAGTLTATNVYADNSLSTSLGSEVTSDSAGRYVPIYLDRTVTYRVQVCDSSGTVIRDVDPLNQPSGDVLTAATFTALGTGSVARAALAKVRETQVSTFDFASAALQAQITGRTTNDAVTAVANATNAIDLTTGSLNFPAGEYGGAGFDFPTITEDRRGFPLRLIGAGTGESFAVPPGQRGTLLTSTAASRPTVRIRSSTSAAVVADLPALRALPSSGFADGTGCYVDNIGGGQGRPYGFSTTSTEVDDGRFFIKPADRLPETAGRWFMSASGMGSLTFKGFRVDGTQGAGIATMSPDGLTGINTVSENVFFQNGEGDGFEADLFTSVAFHQNIMLNRDWDDTPDRVGTGFNYRAGRDHGLASIALTTSRGFQTGYHIGTGVGRPLSIKMTQTESSFVENGIIASNKCEGLTIDTAYLEGVSGTGIDDSGKYTLILNAYNVLDFTTGFRLNGKAATMIGGVAGLNYDGSTGIKVTSAGGVYGTFIFGTSLVRGYDGSSKGLVIDAQGNPTIWGIVNYDMAGASGAKLEDNSYSMEHGGSTYGNGSGVFGMLTRISKGGLQFPALSRASLNLHVDSAYLTASDVGTVFVASLNLPETSVQTLTCTAGAPASFARMNSKNLPDKTGMLIIDNGNVTITGGVYILGLNKPLAFGSGETGTVFYQTVPGVNGVVRITGVHCDQGQKLPTYTVTELATLKTAGIAAGLTVFCTNARNSGEGNGAGTGSLVTFDGSDWKIPGIAGAVLA